MKIKFNKEKEDIKEYDEGLKKSRGEFVSKLSNLSKKYKFRCVSLSGCIYGSNTSLFLLV